MFILVNNQKGPFGRELLSYEIRVDEQADDRYGAFKVGTHDDMVTALGLAVHRTRLLPFEHVKLPAGPSETVVWPDGTTSRLAQ